jgi:hypothetical protein
MEKVKTKKALTVKEIIDAYSIDNEKSGVDINNINTDLGKRKLKTYVNKVNKFDPDIVAARAAVSKSKRKRIADNKLKLFSTRILAALIVFSSIIMIIEYPLLRDGASSYVRKEYEDGVVRLSTVRYETNQYSGQKTKTYTSVIDNSITETTIEGYDKYIASIRNQESKQ